MNLDEVINLLDSLKNSHGIIPKRKFNTLFEILPAHDDGNCLFYSIEQLNSTFDFSELRNKVCEYYKNFDKYKNYPENSIKAALQIQMISDNEEDDGTLHEDNICVDQEWAGIMDVIALTDILKTNIIMMIMRKEGYTVQPYIYNDRAKIIFVKFNGKNHFEPLLPKFDVKSPSIVQSSNKSISSQTRKLIEEMTLRSPPKSISSQTRKLIEEMELNMGRGVNKKTNKTHKRKKHKFTKKRTHKTK